MTTTKRLTLVHLFVVLATVLGVWTVVACNGILGNEIRDADAGAADATDAAADADRCPGEKYCSTIDACGKKDDPSFGCAGPTCTPCSVKNATAKCGGTGCTVDVCFPGFEQCVTGTCSDLADPTTCGKCTTTCPKTEPFCAPIPPVGGVAYGCSATCGATLSSCGTNDHCFDLQTAPNHCGDCATDCHTGIAPGTGKVSCVGGKCQLECLANFHQCGSGADATCEAEDLTHCGPTCQKCPAPDQNETVTCQRQNGIFACVVACSASALGGPNYVMCPGFPGCFDLKSDVNHCGLCAVKCIPTLQPPTVTCTCTNGTCNTPVCKKSM